MKYNWKREYVESIVANSDSITDALRRMGLNTKGGNSRTLKKKIKEYGISIQHFTYGAKRKKGIENYKSAEEYLGTSKPIQTSKLKHKLLKEGIKQNICECCGLVEWNGKPITLQLHHIDGNNKNNELSNLQMLCPNCHSQTENFCNKNSLKKEKRCKVCGKIISDGSCLCFKCASEKKKKLKLSKDELIEEYKKIGSFVGIGEKYLVSDNCVRKAFKRANLPYTRETILEHIKSSISS